MRLYLINPCNSSVSLVDTKKNRLNKWRVWKPLGLLNLAALTPPEWELTVIDENVTSGDYKTMPKPDLVGITAFTSQAERAYSLAKDFRQQGVPVVMGGIHASMCPEEAAHHVDSVVIGEAEEIWPVVLADAKNNALKAQYSGEPVSMTGLPPARHDLLSEGYIFGSVQTTRGCPLSCNFCSVTAFNGKRYRLRPVDEVVEEIKGIKEKFLLIVDDNLVGTSQKHLERAKDLFRAMIKAKVNKRWMTQVTINMADDEELLRLAKKSGCFGVFIGFESPTEEGLAEINKRFNSKGQRDFKASCRRIQKHGIGVLASFIIGLDVDTKGIGERVARAADAYGADLFNPLFLTPLPGTVLWRRMLADDRIAANNFPEDWQNYTLNLPVANYMHLNWQEICAEFLEALNYFYTVPRILRRVLTKFFHSGNLFGLASELVTNIMYKRNIALEQRNFAKYDLSRGPAFVTRQLPIVADSKATVAQTTEANPSV